MSAMPDGYVVLTALNDAEKANELAVDMVKNHYAACVQVVPVAKSVYIWKEELVQTPESMLIIKVSSTDLEKLLEYINQHHPYECPEIIAIAADKIGEKYLSWMCGSR